MGPVAVVDVGANSGRVVVLRPGTGGHLEAIADGRAPLRLALDVRHHGRLSYAAMRVHEEFARQIAEGNGLRR